MSRRLFAAACLAVTMAAPSAAMDPARDPAYRADTCATGPLTIERLREAACIARIPVPAPRYAAPAASSLRTAPARSFEYILVPAGLRGEERRVRLIGSRFLPRLDKSIDLAQPTPGSLDWFNGVVNGTIAWFQDNAAEPAVEVASEQGTPKLSASAGNVLIITQ